MNINAFGVRRSAFGVGWRTHYDPKVLVSLLQMSSRQRNPRLFSETPNAERRTPNPPSIRCLFVILLALTGLAAVDQPYAAWESGRPADAIPALYQRALAQDRWDAWYDLGLAAAAAGDKGRAAVWLIAAARRAPEQPEPRAALSINGTPLPVTWMDRLGPVAMPGTGVTGLILLGFSGLCLGLACTARSRRGLAGSLGVLGLLIAAPGMIGVMLDSRNAWAATVRDTHLLDSAGNPVAQLPAGTVLRLVGDQAWAGRLGASLPNGQRGLVAQSDLVAKP